MNALSLVREIRPARASGARDLPALETALSSLALDPQSPIALELAATSTTRQFLLRARETVALHHLEQQVQARYPQAVITAVSTDPLTRAPGEECSVVELRPGAASYLPLRSWRPRDLLEEGTDPLLGLLAAFGSLPVGMRVVAQLALLPASPTWSAHSRRYAVEHPLEKERAQTMRRGIQERSLKDVLVLLPVVVVAVLFSLFHRLIPSWLIQAGVGLLRGQTPHLTAQQSVTVVVGGSVLLLVLLAGAFVTMVVAGRFGASPLYDQRLVNEKTARPAYKVRLRVFALAPGLPPVAAVCRKRFRWRRLRAALRLRRMVLRRVWRCVGRPLLTEFLDAPNARFRRMLLRTALRLLCGGLQKSMLSQWERLKGRWKEGQRENKNDRAQRDTSRDRRRIREDVLRMVTASYRQYHLASGGYFLPRRLSVRRTSTLLAPSVRQWMRRRTGWAFDLASSSHYLSVADLAALWHLPQAQDLPELSYIDQHTMRTLLAPALLSQVPGYRLGVSMHAGQTLPVLFPFACLRQNVLAAASTGKGKSSLFSHLLRAYALARVLKQTDVPEGVVLIDPHGDLAHQGAGSLPPELADAILLIDLADREFPIAFNPLDMSGGRDRDKVIDNLILVIEALWPTSYGPRTESFLEYSCKTLAEANSTLIADDALHGPDLQYTLLDVIPLFRQTSFRNAVLELVSDAHLLSWWHQYYERLDERQQADFTSSLITKIAKFSSTKIISRILGQPRSSIDLSEIIRQNKIVLFSCASGEIGADMAALFGSLFVGFFQSALQEQARLHPAERHRFFVLIDEFQALSGVNYQVMLAELRKYGGSFALATQSLAYLDRFERTLRATVLANVEHIFAFAMADEDARLLRLPGIEPDDVTQLPSYACYVRLTLNGARFPVFSLHLDAPEPGDPAVRQRIVDRCRGRYGRPVGDVEQILQDCQTRRDGGMPLPGSGPWARIGVQTVGEVAERIRKRKRGSGAAKKGSGEASEREEGGVPPEHLLYDDLPNGEAGI